jgi:membrane-associated protease RseP (regulator of RpoE activity)
MSGPKHLWSGDWRSESQQPATEPLPVRGPEPQGEPAPEATQARRFSRRQLVIVLTTGVAAAAVTVGLVIGLNSGPANKPAAHKAAAAGSSGRPQTSGGQGLSQACQQASTACSTTSTQTPTATPVSTGPTANWMGMQIVTSPSGVVVNTVRVGSPGDLAGFEPGDQIMTINGHVIGTVSELRTDTSGVQVGGSVTIALLRQSVSLTLASIRMTQRPTIHP